MYTIKEAAARAGVSVPVLRAWERRYGVVEPQRTASGYRLYSPDEIARIRTMRELVASGWSPSAAAASLDGLTDAEVRSIQAERSLSNAGDLTDAVSGADPGSLIERFVRAAAALDTVGMEQSLDEIGAMGSFEAVADKYLLPALVSIGSAWENGTLGVAAEHAASQGILRRLATAFAASGRDIPATHPVLLGLPPGSRHELGALAFGVAARRIGVPVLYVGADLPAEDWVGAVARTRAVAAVIGVITNADRDPAASLIAALRNANPELLVAVGGHAAAGLAGANDVLRLPDGLSAAADALRNALLGS